jgi:hypothetical protein
MTHEPIAGAAVPRSRWVSHHRIDHCGVAAAAVITADAAEVARLRAAAGTALKHADEQSVLAVAAVHQAAAPMPPRGPFDDWGVVVAPRWQGRFGVTAVIDKYATAGVRAVSPAAIPNYCLHAPAATVSLALAARGPVFGVGGGPAHVTDGLLTALGVQVGRDTPGTWLALTEWDGPQDAGSGRAVALALVPGGTVGSRWCLTLWAVSAEGPNPPAPFPLREGGEESKGPLGSSPSSRSGKGAGGLGLFPPPPLLAGLAEFLTGRPAVRWDCPLDGGGELTLAREGDA